MSLEDKIEIIAHHYGLESQLNQTTEECGELITAINKFKRYGDVEHLIEEMADVEVMLDQLKYLLKCEDSIHDIKEYKINRQLKRIDEE